MQKLGSKIQYEIFLNFQHNFLWFFSAQNFLCVLSVQSFICIFSAQNFPLGLFNTNCMPSIIKTQQPGISTSNWNYHQLNLHIEHCSQRITFYINLINFPYIQIKHFLQSFQNPVNTLFFARFDQKKAPNSHCGQHKCRYFLLCTVWCKITATRFKSKFCMILKAKNSKNRGSKQNFVEMEMWTILRYPVDRKIPTLLSRNKSSVSAKIHTAWLPQIYSSNNHAQLKQTVKISIGTNVHPQFTRIKHPKII
jgi:hypothetical protein